MTSADLTFGRYRVIDEVGRGGFATVYRAWDPVLDREVALKALFPHLAVYPETRQRFLLESQSLARLRHPNIVAVHDAGEADDRPFFAMELIDGPTMADLLSAGEGLPLPDVASILIPIASALDYLHAAGIVHRDLKPANVMRDASGRPVLMDFGIARVLDHTMYTRAGSSLGTPEYMAPEQVQDEPAGPAADIYCLGLLVFHLLVGQPPFSGSTAHVLHAQAYESPPDLQTLRPGLPDAVYAAVDAALAKDPAARPACAGELTAALWAQGPRPPRLAEPHPAATPEPAPNHQRRRYVRRESAAAPSKPDADTTSVGTEAIVSTVAGDGGPGWFDGRGTKASFQGPSDVCVAADGTLYVADTLNRCIRRIAVDGFVTTLAGSAGNAAIRLQLECPESVAVDPAGSLYVADSTGVLYAIQPRRLTATRLRSKGAVARFINGSDFDWPTGVAVDTVGDVYISESRAGQIIKLPAAAKLVVLVGANGAGLSGLSWQRLTPARLALDATGNLYVSDLAHQGVVRFTSSGVADAVAGSGEKGFADGPADRAQFNQPRGLALSEAGDVYVADMGNHRIRRIAPNGVVSTVAGSGKAGLRDGPASAASFREPRGVANDSRGNLYVADSGNHCIRKITFGGRG